MQPGLSLPLHPTWPPTGPKRPPAPAHKYIWPQHGRCRGSGWPAQLSLQDIRKDVSPLVVARWAAPSLKASGAPCLQMELVGAVGEGCSPRGQFSTLPLHFLLTVLWPRVHRGGLPWGAGRPQRDGLDWGWGKLGDFLSMGVLVWLGRVYCVLQGTVQPPQVEPA